MFRRNPRSTVCWSWSLIASICLLAFSASHPLQAQTPGTYTDLHDFGGTVTNANGTTGPDGAALDSRVTFDSAGNMYGTTYYGGANGHDFGEPGDGIIWELTTAGVYKDLHDFGATITTANGASGTDGFNPQGAVTFDKAGDLFGTATSGGAYYRNGGNGMLWEITATGAYKDLHDFGGPVATSSGGTEMDGNSPSGEVVFDSVGDMYGTAAFGGAHNSGIVWKLTPNGAYTVIHDFGGVTTYPNGTTKDDDGMFPSDVRFDQSGNMYGTTSQGGAVNVSDGTFGIFGHGMLWEITASGQYNDLHNFDSIITNSNGNSGPDGTNPVETVTFDRAGNIYGTTVTGGASEGGIVWGVTSSGVYKDLHDFVWIPPNPDGTISPGGFDPVGSVAVDAAGNLFGTNAFGGLYPVGSPDDHDGNVWEITASGVYKDLHEFGGIITNANGNGGPDGFRSYATVVIDSSGNIYGTTYYGGANSGSLTLPNGIAWKMERVASVTAFQPGLHMFSLPYSYPGETLDTLFGYSGVNLAVWSPATSLYALTPNDPADKIQPGRGYWARFPQTITTITAGVPADPTQNFDIALTKGWNMIGEPFLTSTPVSNLLFNNGTQTFAQAEAGPNPLIGDTVWGYSPTSGQYTVATSLDPEQGYWILAFSNTDLQVPHP